MEQWHLSRAQSPSDSPPSSSDARRQVVISHLKEWTAVMLTHYTCILSVSVFQRSLHLTSALNHWVWNINKGVFQPIVCAVFPWDSWWVTSPSPQLFYLSRYQIILISASLNAVIIPTVISQTQALNSSLAAKASSCVNPMLTSTDCATVITLQYSRAAALRNLHKSHSP